MIDRVPGAVDSSGEGSPWAYILAKVSDHFDRIQSKEAKVEAILHDLLVQTKARVSTCGDLERLLKLLTEGKLTSVSILRLGLLMMAAWDLSEVTVG